MQRAGSPNVQIAMLEKSKGKGGRRRAGRACAAVPAVGPARAGGRRSGFAALHFVAAQGCAVLLNSPASGPVTGRDGRGL